MMKKLKRIVVGLDVFEKSNDVLKRALALANEHKANLLIVHAVRTPWLAVPSYFGSKEIGIDKEGIEIDVKDRVLTLKGERSSENEVKDDNYYRRERCVGKFERAFTLPADVDPDKIKADYKDGVLKVDIPKPEEKKPRQITIH